MPFSSQHPNKKSSRKLPEVAERDTTVPVGRSLHLTIDPRTEEINPLDQYKVFLKRNLKWQAPPADLLSNIHARIDEIKAELEE